MFVFFCFCTKKGAGERQKEGPITLLHNSPIGVLCAFYDMVKYCVDYTRSWQNRINSKRSNGPKDFSCFININPIITVQERALNGNEGPSVCKNFLVC